MCSSDLGRIKDTACFCHIAFPCKLYQFCISKFFIEFFLRAATQPQSGNVHGNAQVAFFSQKGTTILRACLCMGRPVGVLMLPETYRDVTLTVERPSFGNGTQAAEAGNSVSPGSLQQLALPDAIPETEDGMIGFSQKVDDRTAYSLLCKKCGATLYYTAVQAENVEKASQLAKLELCAANRQSDHRPFGKSQSCHPLFRG